MNKAKQKITPFLWFDGQAEEAAKFYTSIFKNSKILSVNPLTVAFELDGQPFTALNGGPQYKFCEAVSFVVHCETQAEVDEYWKKLTAGGQEVQCGWLKDKYGLSWQVVPAVLPELLQDPKKSERVMKALFQMKKLDIEMLKKAAEG